MPRSVVSFAESALGDLEAIKDWYAARDVPHVGDRLVTEVFDRIETLANHPDMGRVVPEFDQPSLRELIHPPFRIVYRRDAGRMRIVRVWRSEGVLHLSSEDDA